MRYFEGLDVEQGLVRLDTLMGDALTRIFDVSAALCIFLASQA